MVASQNPKSGGKILKQVIKVPETTVSQAVQANLKRFLITMIVGTALLVIVGGYFIWVLAKKNVLASNQIKAQDIYIKLAEEKIDVLSQSEEELKQLKTVQGNGVSDFELVTLRALPTTEDLGLALTIFQKLEADTLVKIENVAKPTKKNSSGSTSTSSPATTTTSQNNQSSNMAKSFSVDFKATGSYDQIKKFLKNIENSTRVFDFSKLKITGSTQSLSLDMSYRMYYLPKPSIDDKEIPLSEYKEEGK